MVQTRFDASFGAISDATRRGVLEQLGRADASITALAERFHKLLVVHDLYRSKEALDSGSTGAMPEALDQLDELLASLGSSTETK